MNLLQRRLYKIEGRVVYDYLVGTYNEAELKEGVEVITSTKDLPPKEMLAAQVFSWFMNTFHINGLTNYISRFLYKNNGIEYQDFYEKFFEYIRQDEWLLSEITRIEDHYSNWSKFGRIDHTPIQGIEIHGWNLIHSTIINLHSQNKSQHVFSVIQKFVEENFDLDKDVLGQLVEFQRNYLVVHADIGQYPKLLKFDYDFLGYIQSNNLLDREVSYEYDFPEDKDMDLQRFCEQIFFARRRNFGKSWITSL
jgi:hypothetical protein